MNYCTHGLAEHGKECPAARCEVRDEYESDHARLTRAVDRVVELEKAIHGFPCQYIPCKPGKLCMIHSVVPRTADSVCTPYQPPTPEEVAAIRKEARSARESAEEHLAASAGSPTEGLRAGGQVSSKAQIATDQKVDSERKLYSSDPCSSDAIAAGDLVEINAVGRVTNLNGGLAYVVTASDPDGWVCTSAVRRLDKDDPRINDLDDSGPCSNDASTEDPRAIAGKLTSGVRKVARSAVRDGHTILIRDRDFDRLTALVGLPPVSEGDSDKASADTDLKRNYRKCVDRIGVLNDALSRAAQHIDDFKAQTGGASLVDELDALIEHPWANNDQPISNLGLAGMLACVLSAWRKEANQGDGIDEDHAALFATAESYIREYWPSLSDAPKTAAPRVDYPTAEALDSVYGEGQERAIRDIVEYFRSFPNHLEWEAKDVATEIEKRFGACTANPKAGQR